MKNITAASPTFRNLPEQKRQAISRELVREFAANGYKKASINTIVGNLGIAKGSLYQYFRNKEAMFYFVFEQFTRLVKESVRQGAAEQGSGDFFHQVRQVMAAALSFVDRYPDYFQIYLRILFENDVPNREKLLARVRLFSREYFGPLCREAGKRKELRNDVSPEMMIFILDGVIDRLLRDYVEPAGNDRGLELKKMSRGQRDEKLNEIITILKDGFRGIKKGKQHG